MKKRLSDLLRKEAVKCILGSPLSYDSSDFFVRDIRSCLKGKEYYQPIVDDKSLDAELREEIISIKDLFLFNSFMCELYKKDPKYHAHLLHELQINKKNALIDIGYLEKIIPGMSEVNAKFKVYGKEKYSSNLSWLNHL
jgi:hypothetical protein